MRYHAAVVKNKEVVNGEETYTDSYSKYDIVGVYYDEAAAQENPNQFGITYTNTEGQKVEYEMVKDDQHDEFATASTNWMGQIDRTDAEANKDTVVTFYAPLDDGAGTQSITIKLDKNSTYAENSYFKYDENDHLDDFVDSNNQKLKIVEIDGVKYYDVSGQSVFLISALTCDGYGQYGFSGGGYYGHGGGYEHLGGLDLVLNMETIIKIYQADKAQTVSYLGKEMGKTAQATAPEKPGIEPAAPVVPDPGIEPTAPEVPAPGEAPSIEIPGLEPESGPQPTAPVVDDPGEFTEKEPEAPTPSGRMDYAEKLRELDEKIIVIIDEPVDPTPVIPPVVPVDPPVVIEEPEVPLAEEPVEIPEEEVPLVELPDEDIPLAEVPKTGDRMGLWLGLFGIGLAGLTGLSLRKKKEAE